MKKLPLHIPLLFVFLFLSAGCVTDKEPEHSPLTGRPLPSFTVTLNNGETVSTASLRGKAVLIEFFNTSCEDCRHSFPVIEGVWRYFSESEDVAVFGIAREENAASIEKYWEENSLSFPWSPQQGREIYSKFAQSGIPRIYIADSDGIIIAEYGPDDSISTSHLIKQLQKTAP